jgi:cytochrome c553
VGGGAQWLLMAAYWTAPAASLVVAISAAVAAPPTLLESATAPTAEAVSFYPADAARGKSLASTCLACHGSPSAQPSNQAFHTPRIGGQRPDSIFDALLEYKSGARRSDIMSAVASTLSLQDMRDVAAYLAGAQIKPSPAKISDSQAHERVHADCAACHGETGLGVMPGYPIIGGQYGDYLGYALRAFKSGERSNPTMSVIARGLSEQQIQELAQFFEERAYLRSVE